MQMMCFAFPGVKFRFLKTVETHTYIKEACVALGQPCLSHDTLASACADEVHQYYWHV